MIDEITIIATCEKCDKKIDLNDYEGCIFCTLCCDDTELFGKEYVKQALDEVSELSYHWELDKTYDITFLEEPEKREIYFRGLKKGYLDALFWIADFFDVIKFHETEIAQKFKNTEENDEPINQRSETQ